MAISWAVNAAILKTENGCSTCCFTLYTADSPCLPLSSSVSMLLDSLQYIVGMEECVFLVLRCVFNKGGYQLICSVWFQYDMPKAKFIVQTFTFARSNCCVPSYDRAWQSAGHSEHRDCMHWQHPYVHTPQGWQRDQSPNHHRHGQTPFTLPQPPIPLGVYPRLYSILSPLSMSQFDFGAILHNIPVKRWNDAWGR